MEQTNEEEEPKAIVITVSVYPKQLTTIQNHAAANFDNNRSVALRNIVDFFAAAVPQLTRLPFPLQEQP